jgi:hypothetical protein
MSLDSDAEIQGNRKFIFSSSAIIQDVIGALAQFRARVCGFSERQLTFEQDTFSAFLGVANHLRSRLVGGLEISHLWGLPFSCKGGRPGRRPPSYNHVSLLDSLLWRTFEERNAGLVKRRNAFPSWSWVGWKGRITFDSVMIRVSRVFSLEPEFPQERTSEMAAEGVTSAQLLERFCYPTALVFDCYLFHPVLIGENSLSLDEDIRVRFDGWQGSLYLTGSPNESFGSHGTDIAEAFRHRQLELLLIGHDLYKNFHFLVIMDQGSCALRVGSADFHNFGDFDEFLEHCSQLGHPLERRRVRLI